MFKSLRSLTGQSLLGGTLHVFCKDKTCFVYDFHTNTPEKIANLKYDVNYACSIATTDAELLIVAGEEKEKKNQNKATFVNIDGETRLGPTLPGKKRSRACFVKIDDKSAILFGGATPRFGSTGSKHKQSYFYDIAKSGWTLGPDLKHFRALASCGLLVDQYNPSIWYIIAIGGYVNGSPSRSTAILSNIGKLWLQQQNWADV